MKSILSKSLSDTAVHDRRYSLSDICRITKSTYNRMKTVFNPVNEFPLTDPGYNNYTGADVIRAFIVTVLVDLGLTVRKSIGLSEVIYCNLIDGEEYHHLQSDGGELRSGKGEFGVITLNLKAIRLQLKIHGVLDEI